MSDSAPENNKTTPGQQSAYLHVDGVGPYKWAWVKAAVKAKLSLAEWVKRELNKAAEEQNRDGGSPGL